MRSHSIFVVLIVLLSATVFLQQPADGALLPGLAQRGKVFKRFLVDTGLFRTCKDYAPQIADELAPFGMTLKPKILDTYKGVDCNRLFLGTKGQDQDDNYGQKADQFGVMAYEPFIKYFFNEHPQPHFIIPVIKHVSHIYFDLGELTDCDRITTTPSQAFRIFVKKARQYNKQNGRYGWTNKEFIYLFAMKNINPEVELFCHGKPTTIVFRPRELKFDLNKLFPGWLEQLEKESGKHWKLIEPFIDDVYKTKAKNTDQLTIVEIDDEGKELPLALKDSDTPQEKPKDKNQVKEKLALQGHKE